MELRVRSAISGQIYDMERGIQPGERFKDIAGKRFHHLLILRRAERPSHVTRKCAWWLCRCDCGVEKVISSDTLLRTRGTRSCGCLSREHTRLLGQRAVQDLTGKQFGRLTVIGRGQKPIGTKSRTAFWVCKCVCGKTVNIRASSLTTGVTISCGCYNREVIGKSVVSAATRIYNIYKRMAETRNIEFYLTKDEFIDLAIGPCYYCGIGPQHKVVRRNDEFIYNGIDRVDNLKGYTLGNCVSCCEICNKAKRTMTVDRFRNWVIAIYSHWIEGR